MTKKKFGVLIGRFQPLHKGHQALIEDALKKVDSLIILVGSANRTRTPENPFTFEEREGMIRSVYRHEVFEERIIIRPLNDHLYANAAWYNEVRDTVHAVVLDYGNGHGFQTHGLGDFQIAIAGYAKDASSFYLEMFRDWENILADRAAVAYGATNIREHYLRPLAHIPSRVLPAPVANFLDEFTFTTAFAALVADEQAIKRNVALYGAGPFLTADAVVVHGDHILLGRRGKAPGKGLRCLPGGIVDLDERIYDAAIREAREETGIEDIEDHFEGWGQYDHPKRDPRGRYCGNAYLFRLPEDQPRPDVSAADDLTDAEWVKLDTLKPNEFFGDHWWIIQELALDQEIRDE